MQLRRQNAAGMALKVDNSVRNHLFSPFQRKQKSLEESIQQRYTGSLVLVQIRILIIPIALHS